MGIDTPRAPKVRIIAHPMRFLLKGCIRMYAVSADPLFDRARPRFQEDLIKLIDGVLNDPSLREAATNGITSSRRPELGRGPAEKAVTEFVQFTMNAASVLTAPLLD